MQCTTLRRYFWRSETKRLLQERRSQKGHDVRCAWPLPSSLGMISHVWRYRWLIYYEKKILFFCWKSTNYKQANSTLILNGPKRIARGTPETFYKKEMSLLHPEAKSFYSILEASHTASSTGMLQHPHLIWWPTTTCNNRLVQIIDAHCLERRLGRTAYPAYFNLTPLVLQTEASFLMRR